MGKYWRKTIEGVSTLTTPGFIYFIQGEAGGLIKIGWATNPVTRMAQMQAHGPIKLTLLLAVHGTGSTEREIHARFSECRRHGEWFEPSVGLLSLIEELRQSPPERPTLPPKFECVDPLPVRRSPPATPAAPEPWEMTPEEEARLERMRKVAECLN